MALRLPGLKLRPMHTDEAVHAVKFDTLWSTGQYRYDPYEYHGPTLYYFTLPAAWLSGARSFAETSEVTFRIVPVFFGAGLVLLLLLCADGLGRGAAVCAGVLTTLSPAMSFYNRYYIQETLLVFFQFAVIATVWRYACARRARWAVVAGAFLGLIHATKETCVLTWGAMLVALVITLLWARYKRSAAVALKPYFRAGPLLGAAVVALGVSIVFYSGCFTNLHGPADALRAYGTYIGRASGGAHVHPWYYYLRMLLWTHALPGPVWSEALIIGLAVLGLVAALRGSVPTGANLALVRFVGVYTFLITLVYSAIPYKTPWSMLGFLHGMILLAGVGAATLLRWLAGLPLRVAVGAVLLTATAQLGWQAYRTNFRFYADYRNPYVYAHPVMDVLDLARWVGKLADVHADGRRMLIRVIASDPWPLPWYLRTLERVGYWEEPPEDCDAPVIIVAAEREAAVGNRLRGAYHVSLYGLRPDVVLQVYVDRALYDAFVERERRKTPAPTETVGG